MTFFGNKIDTSLCFQDGSSYTKTSARSVNTSKQSAHIRSRGPHPGRTGMHPGLAPKCPPDHISDPSTAWRTFRYLARLVLGTGSGGGVSRVNRDMASICRVRLKYLYERPMRAEETAYWLITPSFGLLLWLFERTGSLKGQCTVCKCVLLVRLGRGRNGGFPLPSWDVQIR
jgi:hypothetical protein